MEARFNEKVREFQDLIASRPDDARAIEAEMFEYMARTAPFIKEYHQESSATTSTKTVANIKISSRKGVQRQDIYQAYLAEVEEVHGQAKTNERWARPCPNCGQKFSFIFDEAQSEDSCILVARGRGNSQPSRQRCRGRQVLTAICPGENDTQEVLKCQGK